MSIQYKFSQFNDIGSIMYMDEIDLQTNNCFIINEQIMNQENKYKYINCNITSNTNILQILQNLKENQSINDYNMKQIELLLKITEPITNSAYYRAKYKLLMNQYYRMYTINMNNKKNLRKLLIKMTRKTPYLFI